MYFVYVYTVFETVKFDCILHWKIEEDANSRKKNPWDGKKGKKVEKLVLFASSKETSGAGEIWKCSLKPRYNKKSAPNSKTSQLSEQSKRFPFSFIATLASNQHKSLR